MDRAEPHASTAPRRRAPGPHFPPAPRPSSGRLALAAGLATLGWLAPGAAQAQLLDFGSQLWHQNVAEVADAAEPDDLFGQALASGDFNGDGRADLAVGVPGQPVGEVSAGAVHVFYAAGTQGLAAAGNEVFHQGRPGMLGAAEEGDLFGFALAAGDFNGDGFRDLAVGVPSEDVEAPGQSEGATQVLYGAPSGLGTASNQLWTQSSPGVSGDSEFLDQFGASLAAGDFDGDGFDDLAIGLAAENFEGILFTDLAAGRVVVLYGAAGGLSADREQEWHQDSPGIDGAVEGADFFGIALAVADFNGDGFDDLAAGVFGENDGKGAVNLIYGSASGLTAAGNKLWEQGADGIEGEGEDHDNFGRALGAGDFNGDGFADLAVGVPEEDLGPMGSEVIDAGAVNVFYGSALGLAADGNQLWHQDVAGVLEVAEPEERFGLTLTTADPNGDGFADLVIGVPDEVLASGAVGGAVQVLHGTEFGLLIFGNEVWSQDSAGIAGGGEGGDLFGGALAAGDFDGLGHVDLAIGVPREDLGAGETNVGAAHVLYGYLFADGFESGDTGAWSGVVP